MVNSDVSRPHPAITEVLTSLEKLNLETIEDRDFVGEDVYLDGRLFRNCSFQNCNIYVKIGRFQIDKPKPRGFDRCTFKLDGPAEMIKALVEGVSGR